VSKSQDDERHDASPPPWFAGGLSFECTCCGNCCTGGEGAVWFDDDEGRAMARTLGMDFPEFLVRYTRVIEGHRSLNEHLTGWGHDCVFLDRETIPGKAICKVYEARPRQCRTWPFWPELVRNENAWSKAKRNTPCPGMGQGRLFTVEEIVARLNEQREAGDTPW
jgi:Fe-S-cluster containining protein